MDEFAVRDVAVTAVDPSSSAPSRYWLTFYRAGGPVTVQVDDDMLAEIAARAAREKQLAAFLAQVPA